MKSFEGIPNEKIVNGRRYFNCTQCGECCHIREKNKLNVSDEAEYKKLMLETFGIIYLANLSDITINILPEEAEILKKRAEEKGLKLNIKPKRAILTKHNQLIILDYYIDHDICPFFDRKNRTCGVYSDRPLICQAYPLLTPKTLGKCEYKLENVEEYLEEKDPAQKLAEITDKQKSAIRELINGEQIIIPDNTDPEFLLNNFHIKEMRVK